LFFCNFSFGQVVLSVLRFTASDYPLVFSYISRVCIGNEGCYNLHIRMNIDDEFIPGVSLNQTKRIYNVKITFFFNYQEILLEI
jgi:hypothetical protein